MANTIGYYTEQPYVPSTHPEQEVGSHGCQGQGSLDL